MMQEECMASQPRSVAEVDSFITMLRAACDDAAMHKTLTTLLSQPDAKRQAMVRWLVHDLQTKRAPQPLREAIACLLDDAVAEQAYVAIFECQR
jgi:hypothetical protein